MLCKVVFTTEFQLKYLFRIHHFNLEYLTAEPVVFKNDLTPTLINLASFEPTKELVGKTRQLNFIIF